MDFFYRLCGIIIERQAEHLHSQIFYLQIGVSVLSFRLPFDIIDISNTGGRYGNKL